MASTSEGAANLFFSNWFINSPGVIFFDLILNNSSKSVFNSDAESFSPRSLSRLEYPNFFSTSFEILLIVTFGMIINIHGYEILKRWLRFSDYKMYLT